MLEQEIEEQRLALEQRAAEQRALRPRRRRHRCARACEVSVVEEGPSDPHDRVDPAACAQAAALEGGSAGHGTAGTVQAK
eukprot:8416702-Heterocapsa_arctica.AAC.1